MIALIFQDCATEEAVKVFQKQAVCREFNAIFLKITAKNSL